MAAQEAPPTGTAIAANVSGCRTRRAGAPFAAPGKRRDGPRVGRKERSDWSRQPGVMRSATLLNLLLPRSYEEFGKLLVGVR